MGLIDVVDSDKSNERVVEGRQKRRTVAGGQCFVQGLKNLYIQISIGWIRKFSATGNGRSDLPIELVSDH